jgi:hypothetical protein
LCDTLALSAQVDEDDDAEEELPGESTMDEEPPSTSPAAGATQQQPGGTPAAAKAKRQAGSAVFNEVVIDEVRVWSVASSPASTRYCKSRQLGNTVVNSGAHHSLP